jgi:hypothetical protein
MPKITMADLPRVSAPQGAGLCLSPAGVLLFDDGDSLEELSGGGGSSGATVTLSPASDAGVQNSATAQAALSSNNIVTISGRGTFLLSDTLVFPDDTKLIINEGVELKLAPGRRRNMFISQGYLNPDYAVASLTSAGTLCTLVLSEANWNALSPTVGSYIAVNWALPQFYSGVFEVLSINAGTFTLTYRTWKIPSNATATASATAGVAAASTIKVRRASKNIQLINHGVINWDEANQAGAGSGMILHAVVFSHAWKPHVEGAFINAGKYNVYMPCTSHAYVPYFFSKGPSDGLHFTGPAWYPTVGKITGENDDNLIAFGAGDYLAYHISEGAIVGAYLDDLIADNAGIDVLRLWGTSAYSADLTHRRLSGYVNNGSNFCVKLINDNLVLPDGNSWVSNYELEDCDAQTTTFGVVQSRAIRLDNIKVTPNYKEACPSGQSFLHLENSTTLGLVTIEGTWIGGSSTAAVRIQSSLAANAKILFNGLKATGAWGISNNSTRDVELTTNGCDLSGLTNTLRSAGATGKHTIKSSGSSHPAASFIRTSGGTFESYGFDVRMPATTDMALTNGQMMNNNGALNITKSGAWAAL